MTDKLDEMFELQQQLGFQIEKTRTPEMIPYPKGMYDRVYALGTAIIHESVEMQRETNWKWWKKPKEVDHAAVEEELVDILHFVIQAAQELGMSPTDMYEKYIQKRNKNVKRAETNYVEKSD